MPWRVLAVPLGHSGKLLPTSEGHRDGIGEMIRDNILDLENQVHSSPGAPFTDSTAPALQEPWGEQDSFSISLRDLNPACDPDRRGGLKKSLRKSSENEIIVVKSYLHSHIQCSIIHYS